MQNEISSKGLVETKPKWSSRNLTQCRRLKKVLYWAASLHKKRNKQRLSSGFLLRWKNTKFFETVVMQYNHQMMPNNGRLSVSNLKEQPSRIWVALKRSFFEFDELLPGQLIVQSWQQTSRLENKSSDKDRRVKYENLMKICSALVDKRFSDIRAVASNNTLLKAVKTIIFLGLQKYWSDSCIESEGYRHLCGWAHSWTIGVGRRYIGSHMTSTWLLNPVPIIWKRILDRCAEGARRLWS